VVRGTASNLATKQADTEFHRVHTELHRVDSEWRFAPKRLREAPFRFSAKLCVNSVKLCVRLLAQPRTATLSGSHTAKARMNIANSDGLTQQIIGLAMRVHTHLGCGLLENAYERCLCHEFDRTR
jgi:hypothetical protein